MTEQNTSNVRNITTADLFSESLSNKAFFTKDSQVGDTVTGTVIESEPRQTRNFDTNKLETWDDGSPMLQLVVSIQTDLTEDAEDDGVRSVYIKWWGESRKSILKAVKASGAPDILDGGTFTASYIGDGEQLDRKKSPPKIYAYEYTAPGGIAKANAKK